MTPRNQIPSAERQVRSLLLQELANAPLLNGRLYWIARTCGHPGCRCARGEKHVSLYLHVHQQGKDQRIYIPKVLEEAVQKAVANYRAVEEKLQTLSRAQLQRLLEEKTALGHTRPPKS